MKKIRAILGFLLVKFVKKSTKVSLTAKEVAKEATQKIEEGYTDLELSEKKYVELIENSKEQLVNITKNIEVQTAEHIDVKEQIEIIKQFKSKK